MARKEPSPGGLLSICRKSRNHSSGIGLRFDSGGGSLANQARSTPGASAHLVEPLGRDFGWLGRAVEREGEEAVAVDHAHGGFGHDGRDEDRTKYQ
jgi:hypothetical protein